MNAFLTDLDSDKTVNLLEKSDTSLNDAPKSEQSTRVYIESRVQNYPQSSQSRYVKLKNAVYE